MKAASPTMSATLDGGPGLMTTRTYSDEQESAASSYSSRTNPYLQKEEELNRESSWSPLSIVKTLTGFNPEPGLEYVWSEDGSSAGGSVATRNGSISACSTNESNGSTTMFFSKLRQKNSGLSPSSDASYEEQQLQTEVREAFDVMCERDAIEVRDLPKEITRGYDVTYETGAIEVRECLKEIKEDVKVEPHEPSESFQNNETGGYRSEWLLREPKEDSTRKGIHSTTCSQSPVVPKTGYESPSVEVSLIEKKESRTRMKCIKRVLRGLFVRKEKSTITVFEPYADNEDQSFDRDDEISTQEPPLVPVSSALVSSSLLVIDELQLPEKVNESMVVPSVEENGTEVILSTVTSDLPETRGTGDMCLKAVGLGCLAP